LLLTGTKSNRNAIGARIRITVLTPTGKQLIYNTVSTGGSFGGNPFRREIGLGAATRIEEIAIRWPGSTELQSFTSLKLRTAYAIREGDSSIREVQLPSVQKSSNQRTP